MKTPMTQQQQRQQRQHNNAMMEMTLQRCKTKMMTLRQCDESDKTTMTAAIMQQRDNDNGNNDTYLMDRWIASAKINISYSILFNLTTSYSSYFGGKKGISRNKRNKMYDFY